MATTEWLPSAAHPEIHWDVDDETYFADTTAISQSMLKTHMESPMLYRGRYVTGEFPPDPPGKALQVGSALHAAILEPDKFAAGYAAAPDCDRRTTAGKQLYAAFCEESAGKTVLSQGDHANVQRMADGVFASDMARSLLEHPRLTEQAFRWRDAGSGLELKAKLDILIPDAFDYALVVDIKSSKDPTPEKFAKSVCEYGYDIQEAFYKRAASLFAGKLALFAFLVIRSEPPYDCWVYHLVPQWQTAGELLLNASLAALADAYEKDYWLAPGQEMLTALEAPGWARNRLGL
jgi:hypothetical protein